MDGNVDRFLEMSRLDILPELCLRDLKLEDHPNTACGEKSLAIRAIGKTFSFLKLSCLGGRHIVFQCFLKVACLLKNGEGPGVSFPGRPKALYITTYVYAPKRRLYREHMTR